MANPSRTLFIIADRTGITLENLVRTLLTQFDDLCCERMVLPFLDTAGWSLGWRWSSSHRIICQPSNYFNIQRSILRSR